MSNNFECDNSSWGFENNSVSDREQCLRNKNVDSSVFGSYNNTYDWVECESTSFPGTVYYFNLRTLCTTWTRPVSRHVPLQRFQRNVSAFGFEQNTFDKILYAVTGTPTLVLRSYFF